MFYSVLKKKIQADLFQNTRKVDTISYVCEETYVYAHIRVIANLIKEQICVTKSSLGLRK